MFTVEVETATDWALTASLATQAFGTAFDPERLRWLYEEAFGPGTIVVGLRHDGVKVGHVAMLRQAVATGGGIEAAGQIVDLFVLPEHRSKERVAEIYGEVARACREQGIRFAFAMPNARALSVNQRYFELRNHMQLPIRVGSALPLAGRSVQSRQFERGADGFAALLEPYGTAPGDSGLAWTSEGLLRRLSDPTRRYGVHAARTVLLVSAKRWTRNVGHTLLCGFLPRTGVAPSGPDVRAVVRAACAMWRQPLFVYVGTNARLPYQPGFALPDRLRPSAMMLQARDFESAGTPLRLDRFQLLDFDLARY